MSRLIMVAAASLLTLVLTGCGEDKEVKPEATVTTTSQPADEAQPATTTTTTTPTPDEKPAE
jgi:ABC-type glycerol-3-phosphate transport system substrate-binding protein